MDPCIYNFFYSSLEIVRQLCWSDFVVNKVNSQGSTSIAYFLGNAPLLYFAGIETYPCQLKVLLRSNHDSRTKNNAHHGHNHEINRFFFRNGSIAPASASKRCTRLFTY